MQEHLDEFLLSVGPATGQLLNLLAKESEAKTFRRSGEAQRGAVVVRDDMTYPESARKHAEAYRKHIRKKSGIQSVLLSVGSGLELTRYK